jgi:hypothetical protein
MSPGSRKMRQASANCGNLPLLFVRKSHIRLGYPPLESKHATIRHPLKSWGSFISVPPILKFAQSWPMLGTGWMRVQGTCLSIGQDR